MAKKIDLEELLIFINSNYVDDRLYILVPHLYEKDTKFEIMWTGELNEPKWLVRQKSPDNTFEHISTDSLISILNKKKVNLVEVHIELMQKVLTNIAHLSLIIERGGELFGEDLVNQACANLRKYYSELQITIEKILVSPKKEKAPRKKTKLSLIENEEKDGQDKGK